MAGVGFWRLLNILDPDAHIGHWRTRPPSFFISQKRNDVLDAVCTGAVFVSLLEQESVERLQILFCNLMNKDFGAGLLKKIERQLVCGVRLGCQLFNVAEVGLDLGVDAVAVRGNGVFRRRALGGKLLLASVNGFADRRLVPRGGGIGSEGLPRPFAVTLGALVVGCFGMVFLGAPYKAPERTQTGLAVEDRSAI